jgi:multisite-specific tRNA:(cytosine-C5)-methyltransferase
MASIKTRVLVLSDTHGDDLIHKPTGTYDVAIHCGDLTEESKLDEFRVALDTMLSIQAPLKLIIAGNHDFSMDVPVLANKLADNTTAEDADLVKRTYGDFGEAHALFETDAAKAAGVRFLDEGNYTFDLANGASLSIYASPYTASKACTWGFQYRPSDDHHWDIKPNTDIAITHSPPHGVLDYTGSKTRAGSPSLFAAIAQAKPKMHCFGHIHEAWGAKVVGWRPTDTTDNTKSEFASAVPTHFTAIDNDRSNLIESLASLRQGKFDTPDSSAEKAARRERYNEQGCCTVDQSLESDQTLFVNAAIEGPCEGMQQHPWVVELDLPASA